MASRNYTAGRNAIGKAVILVSLLTAFLLANVDVANAQCNQRGGSAATAASCTWTSISNIGPGEFRTLATTNGVLYEFDFVSAGSAGGVNAGTPLCVNGTAYNTNVQLLTGNGATWNIGINQAGFPGDGWSGWNNGTGSSVLQYRIATPTNVNAGADVNTCTGATTLSGSADFGTISWSAGAPNVSGVVVNSSNTYTVTANNGGCTSTDQVIVYNRAPAAVSASGAGTICAGGSLTLSASGGAGGTIYYQGTNASGTSTGLGGSSVPVSTAGTHYFRSYNSTYACWSTISNGVVVTVVADPVLTNPSNTGNICVGGSASFTSTPSGAGTGTISYIWEYSNNNSTFATVSTGTPTGASYSGTGGDILTVSGITAIGTHYYRRLLSTNAQGCDAVSNSANVVVVADPTFSPATPTITYSTICAGGTVSVATTLSGGTGSLTASDKWQYSTNGGVTWFDVSNLAAAQATYTGEVDNPLVITLNNAGSYQFRRVLTDNGVGCENQSNAVSLTVVSDPAVSIAIVDPAGLPTVCNTNNQVSFTSSISSGTGSYTYLWQQSPDNSTWSSATGTNNLPTYTTPVLAASAYYRLQITNTVSGLGCTTIASTGTQVIIPGAPTPGGTNYTASPPTVSGCGNAVLAAAVGANGNAVNFYWSPSQTSQGTQETDVSVGTETYQIATYNTVTGCESPTLDVITVVSPSFDFTPSTVNANCFGAANGSATITTITGTPPYSF